VVSNAFGAATSNEATLTVTSNQPPAAAITTPVAGTIYQGGQTITYSGTGTDPETGNLPASAFTWQVDFHHDTHTHPHVPPTSGVTSGSFVIPSVGETSTNVWYRIYLTVTDPSGLSHTVYREIFPQISTITLQTSPSGLQLTLDGAPTATPTSLQSVAGINRTLGVVSPQDVGGTNYVFSSWSDGGAATHTISTPSANTTYTATFVSSCSYVISPTSRTIASAGGTGSVSVTAPAGCAWTAASNASWITITGGAGGAGNGTAQFSIAANPNAAPRSGTMTIAGQTFTVAQDANLGGLMYYPLPHPVRLLDTRPNFSACDAPGAPLAGGASRTVAARGVTCDGVAIPGSAVAVAGNATVVNFISGGGFVTLHPSGEPRPATSNLNFTANHIVPNAFTVKLGANGGFEIFSNAATHFIVDITGYYAPPGAGGLYFHPLPAPVRLLDTRPDPFTSCFASSTPLAGGGMLTLPATGGCGSATIPASAKAVVGNATVVNFQSGGGYITLFPEGAPPNASNLNFTANHIVPNSFVAGLSASGSFKIFASASTNFIVDIAGYFSDQAVDVNGPGLLFYPLPAPARWLDTRPDPFVSCIPASAPLAAGSISTLQAQLTCEGQTIPAGAKSVLGNATVVNFQSGGGFVTLFPSDATLPNASNLNFTASHIVPNSFVVGLGGGGAFKLFTSAATHFIVDLSGYFAP